VNHGPGLRGGTFTTKGDPTIFKLTEIRFVRDATVTGSGKWNSTTGAVSGRFRVSTQTASTLVNLSWNQDAAVATATFANGSRATLPAP
jgi:hypothetical protein